MNYWGIVDPYPHPALRADLSRRERVAAALRAPSEAKAFPLPPGEVGPTGRVRVRQL
jgi:hypothetical protein